MTRYSKEISYGGVRHGARTSNGLGPQFGTEPAPRTARADRNGFAPRSHCASPAQPRTGRNNRNGHVPPSSPHSWHTSQEAQIELATRREDHVTRSMDRIHALTTLNNSSEMTTSREPWTDPRAHDAERYLWGAAIIILLYTPCFPSTGSGGSREHALA
jgi:hypothetical protein